MEPFGSKRVFVKLSVDARSPAASFRRSSESGAMATPPAATSESCSRGRVELRPEQRGLRQRRGAASERADSILQLRSPAGAAPQLPALSSQLPALSSRRRRRRRLGVASLSFSLRVRVCLRVRPSVRRSWSRVLRRCELTGEAARTHSRSDLPLGAV